MSEEVLLRSLRGLLQTSDPSVLIGSGPDDCAHVRHNSGILSITMDAFVEGTHFSTDAAPEDIAWKSLAASLSDLAASGCMPKWALVSLALRPGLPSDWSGRFAYGLAAAAAELGAAVIGGDIVSAAHEISISVTAVGEPMAGGPVTRGGAQINDVLVVTGKLGGSLLGRHLHPVPRFAEMRGIMEFCTAHGQTVHAAMDISDGLALDCTRLCRESGVGALLETKNIPISDQAGHISMRDGITPLQHALQDGEDFELLLALSPEIWEDFRKRPQAENFSGIGTVTKEPGIFLHDGNGRKPLQPQGYEHTW